MKKRDWDKIGEDATDLAKKKRKELQREVSRIVSYKTSDPELHSTKEYSIREKERQARKNEKDRIYQEIKTLKSINKDDEKYIEIMDAFYNAREYYKGSGCSCL